MTVLPDSANSWVPTVALLWLLALVLVLLSWAFNVMGIIAAAVLVTALAIASIWLLPRVIAWMKWHDAHLEVSSHPASLGETITVTYRRKSRRKNSFSSETISIALDCIESASYTVGTTTETSQSKVFEKRAALTLRPEADALQGSQEFTIPTRAGAPSFKLSNNTVYWQVRVWAGTNSQLPNSDSTFVLQVQPQLWIEAA